MLAAGGLAACGPIVRVGLQLDSLLVDATGLGTGATHSFRLPHGRYTVFSYDDPADCIENITLVDSHGRGVASDGAFRAAPMPPGTIAQQMLPSFVQLELQEDTYHFVVRTRSASCAWMAQGILNSILDLLGTPPDPVKPPVATSPLPVQIAQGSSQQQFDLSQPGLYHAKWTVTFPQSDPACAYDLSLVASDGHREHLGDSGHRFSSGGAGSEGSDGPLFLGASRWRVAASGGCPWTLSISPWIGSLGGGVQGFAAS
jgi:hypothetical protein